MHSKKQAENKASLLPQAVILDALTCKIFVDNYWALKVYKCSTNTTGMK